MVRYALQNRCFFKKKKNRNVNDKMTVQFQNSLIFNQAKLLKAPLAVLPSQQQTEHMSCHGN